MKRPGGHHPNTRFGHLKGIGLAAAAGLIVATVGAVAHASNSGSIDPGTAEAFVGVTPTRILDTRVPIGVATAKPMTAGQTLTLDVAGTTPVPDEASSVAINITTGADATERSFITVYPTGTSRPVASSNNASPGLVKANGVSVRLGTGGAIDVYNYHGDTNVIIDVTGYYVPMDEVTGMLSAELLTGSGAPAPGLGDDGDTYIDLTAKNFYGAKTSGNWGSPLPLGGTSGSELLTGSGVPAPGLGDDGDTYIDLTTGDFYGPKSSGNWGTPLPLGGTAGSELLTGSGVPAPGLGDDGDTYIDLTTGDFYGPKSSGNWGTPLPLAGPPTASTDSALGAFSTGTLLAISIGDVALPFGTPGASVGTAITQLDDDTFTLNDAGVYQVSYTLSTSVSLAGDVSVEVDGTPVGPSFALLSAGLPTSGTVLVHADAGDTLEIIKSGISAIALLDASITIELVATT